MAQNRVKFSELELFRAVDSLATLPFFPQDSRGAVMEFVAQICPHREALEWLISRAVELDKWPGLGEIRGLLCTKWDAADGIDRYCSLPGYSGGECESRHLEQHLQVTGKSVGYESAGPGSPAARGNGGYIADESRALIRMLVGGD